MALADYLDGYEEFLDEHDRRALGLAAVPTQRMPQALTQRVVPAYYSAPTTGPTQQALVPAAAQYAPSMPVVLQPAPSRLRAALLPAGRAMAIPFAQTGPTVLNPGSTPIGPASAMPMAPLVMSVPSSNDTPTILQDPTSSTPSSSPSGSPSSYVPSGITSQSGAGPASPGGSSGSASGSAGVSSSTVGWLLLLAGGYWMYRNV